MAGDDDAPSPSARVPSAALRAAVEAMYDVFGHYRRARPLNVCRCPVCVAPEAEEALSTTPLRQISGAVMGQYTASAHGYDEVVDGDTFRHFLPRYCDLIARGDAPDTFGEVHFCLSRLGTAAYRTAWPAREAEAVDRFFEAILRDVLADGRTERYPARVAPLTDAASYLIMIARAGGDIARALGVLDQAADPAAAMHIAEMAVDVSSGPEGYFFKTPLIDADSPLARALGAWIARPEVLARLQAAFFAAPDDAMQSVISLGVDTLSVWPELAKAHTAG